jgi:hypothetical protein
MSPGKMRFVLAVSFVLAVAVVINVLGRGEAGSGQMVLTARPVSLTAPARPAAATAGTERAAAGQLQAVRRELVTRGYLTNPGEGPLDARTRAAIMAFEFDHGLTLTAAPSETTLKNLIFEAKRTTSPGAGMPAKPEAVALIENVQRALERIGYAKSATTGRLDGATRSAIRAFERARGLDPSGRISAALVDGLGPALAAR